MKYLLDTNVILWLTIGNKKLGEKTRKVLSDTDPHLLVVSVISSWEVYIKVSIGKLQLDVYLEQFLTTRGITILPVQGEHARQVLKLPHIHRDPFDRMLIAQSVSEKMTLITSDDKILQYPDVLLIDAKQ